MKKSGIANLITRIVLHRELSGYDIYREMLAKGVQIRPNYAYMILTEMRSKGLLSARWVESQRGPRRHLYSLSEKGREEFRQMLRDSLTVMMDAYVQANLKARDGADHANSIKSSFDRYGVPHPGRGDRVVIATPPFDPLICLPLGFRVMSEIFPSSSIVVVKPPGVRFYDDRPNVTFLDGQRHDMPLKDGFADYLMLEGFPREASVKDTIRECARVLKENGHFILRVPKVMTEEQTPKFTNFAEFTMKQYYDVLEQDRKLSLENLRILLSEYFEKQKEAEIRGIVIFYATCRKSSVATPQVNSTREMGTGKIRAALVC